MFNLKKRVILGVDNGLLLNFSKFNRYFGVTLKIEQENKEDQNLSFEFKVKHIESRFKSAIIEIDRFNLRINHQEPDDAIDKLAYRCGNVIYPLRIFINERLEVLNIENHEDILFRWEKLKEDLNNDEITEVMQWYINKTEKSIKNVNSIKENIKQNLFLSALFAPIYVKYIFFHNNVKAIIKVPIVPNTTPIQYRVLQQVEREYTTFNTITVTQKGRIIDKRSAYEIATGSIIGMGDGERPNGTLDLIYQLDKDTKIIDAIIANYTIELPYNESRKIEMQAFKIEEKKNN